ncbi:hypothetical protein BT67DRAFT_201871 [Trichocladium antarcticum]|uniref:Uncharacterized protein n=1 Tax=Trichocladium antarcticum TaxID=1450529 RepID=A0AAN6USI0_9PEZI|nr:hypothetical protein BT67DRAFT_201871 [Trichocladium antarcticum]
MCHIVKKIYTVCAHSTEEGPFECQAQKERRERYDGFLRSFRASISRCWPPVRLTEQIYGFCEDCRLAYSGHDTRRVSAILNYWACRGYSESVPAGSIPSNKVFCRSLPEQDLKRPRGELVALGKVIPQRRREPRGWWLQRLEAIRISTLEWAEYPPRTDKQRTANIRQQVNPEATVPMRHLTPVQKTYGHGAHEGVGNGTGLRAEGSAQQRNNVESSVPASGRPRAEDTQPRDSIIQALVPAPLRLRGMQHHHRRSKPATDLANQSSIKTQVDVPTDVPKVHIVVSQGRLLTVQLDEECEPNMTSRFSFSDDESDSSEADLQHAKYGRYNFDTE